MWVGYVSDERYLALADVGVEFERDGQMVAVVKSTPRGAIAAGAFCATWAPACPVASENAVPPTSRAVATP